MLLGRVTPRISESLANSSAFLNSGEKKAIGNSGENGASRFSSLWLVTALLFVGNRGVKTRGLWGWGINLISKRLMDKIGDHARRGKLPLSS